MELFDGNDVRSANHVDLYLYPESGRRAPRPHRINVYRADRQKLHDAGYETRDGIDPDIPVTVAGAFDARIDVYLGAGGTLLLFTGDGTQVAPSWASRSGPWATLWLRCRAATSGRTSQPRPRPVRRDPARESAGLDLPQGPGRAAGPGDTPRRFRLLPAAGHRDRGPGAVGEGRHP